MRITRCLFSRARDSFTWSLADEHVSKAVAASARKQIQQAFDDWAQGTSLTFEEVQDDAKVDFNIAFIEAKDSEDADEAGETLASADFPPGNGIRFETGKDWTNL